MQTPATHEFVRTFFQAPNGSSPDDIRERILYWIERAAHPEQFVPQDTPANSLSEVTAHIRRRARQNALRLAGRHPEVRDQLIRERQQESQ